MRKHILIAAIVIAASSLIFLGCQKDNPTPLDVFFEKQSSLQSAERGLNISSFPNDIEIYLYKQVSLSNQQEHFFSHLTQRIGDPFWAHTEIYANRASNKELVFLPFGFYGTKEVKAVLQGVRDLDKPNSDYKLQLFLRSELLNYTNTSSYVNEVMAAQFGDFEHTIYGIDDPIWMRVFESIQTINSANRGVRAACEDIPVTICYEIPCPPSGGGGNDDDGWFSSGIGLYSGFGKWMFTLGGGSASGSSGGGFGGSINGVGCGWRCKINKIKNRCFKRPKKDDDNGGVLNKGSERSVVGCQECQDYLVKVCPGEPNWWNKPWNMTPCSECNNTSSAGNNEILEFKCKSNRNAQLKGKYNIKTSLSTINQITESTCSCIGNVNYDKCVLDNLFMECYSPGTPTPSNTVLHNKMQQLFADNPCFYGKVKCGDAADLALIKAIAESNANLSADFNCGLFDYLKAFPGAEINDAINAVRIQDLKEKYPEYSDIISSFTANPSSDKIDFIMNLLESLKNDKGDTNLPNNGPSLSPGIFVCPSSIQYDNKPDRFNTVGISNLNMTFTLKNGDQIQASTGKLFINIDNDICLNVFVGNCSTHIAKAVEAAYNAVNVYVTNTTPTPTQKQIEDRFALEFGCILYKGFLDVNAIPEGGGRSCDVIRPASTNDKFLTYGTTFNNQLTTSNTPCP